MTGHQINSLVGDLVAMAQAMERLPQVEAERDEYSKQLSEWTKRYDELAADLTQSRDYAASLEAKVHAAEVARDDAELRFLEADEKLEKVAKTFQVAIEKMDDVDRTIAELTMKPEPVTEPKPEPIDWSKVEVETTDPHDLSPMPIGDMQPAVQGQSESNPTSAPTQGSASLGSEDHASSASTAASTSTEGQSEPLPTQGSNVGSLAVDHSPTSASESAIQPDTAYAEPKSQPYAGKRYVNVPGWVSRENWLAGGGTEEDYYWRPEMPEGSAI